MRPLVATKDLIDQECLDDILGLLGGDRIGRGSGRCARNSGATKATSHERTRRGTGRRRAPRKELSSPSSRSCGTAARSAWRGGRRDTAAGGTASGSPSANRGMRRPERRSGLGRRGEKIAALSCRRSARRDISGRSNGVRHAVVVDVAIVLRSTGTGCVPVPHDGDCESRQMTTFSLKWRLWNEGSTKGRSQAKPHCGSSLCALMAREIPVQIAPPGFNESRMRRSQPVRGRPERDVRTARRTTGPRPTGLSALWNDRPAEEGCWKSGQIIRDCSVPAASVHVRNALWPWPKMPCAQDQITLCLYLAYKSMAENAHQAGCANSARDLSWPGHQDCPSCPRRSAYSVFQTPEGAWTKPVWRPELWTDLGCQLGIRRGTDLGRFVGSQDPQLGWTIAFTASKKWKPRPGVSARNGAAWAWTES